MDLKEVEWEVVHWIKLAQDTEKGGTLLNTDMNLRVQYKADEELAAFQGLCTTELVSVRY